MSSSLREREGTISNTTLLPHFGSPFSSKAVVCGHCLVTLSLTINETLKWLASLPLLTQESFWWRKCSDRYIISLFPPPQPPHPHTPPPPHPPHPPPFSPSLISLMVSVDVKHHVYLLTPSCLRRGSGGLRDSRRWGKRETLRIATLSPPQ